LRIVKYYGIPGSGKTTKLRSIVEAEVARGVPLIRIGYLSFTKGAADVIKTRMKATDADVKWFRTIHSAAMAMLGIGRESVLTSYHLKQFKLETGMEIRSDEFDDWDIEKPIDFTPTRRAFDMAAATQKSVYEIAREMPAHVNLTQSRIEHFGDCWGTFKRDNHLYDFTDMLVQYIEQDGPALPVDVLILDEAQDLSELQWAVFHRLARDAQIVYMAGDDDQAIYPFIGGSEFGFLDHPVDEEHVIGKSWRVPQLIGEQADAIIQKIAHRKPKKAKWMDKEGRVTRMNHDAFSLPWRDLLAKYDSIMVLTRHRKGARGFSDDLKAVGVPHDANGEGLGTWPEARIIHTYYELREGRSVTVKQAMKLLAELEIQGKELQGLKPRAKVGVEKLPGIDFSTPTWVNYFAGDNRTKTKRYEAIRQLINQDGPESLVRPPRVRISTMHAAKGAEADLIIVVPECTSIVRRNVMTPAEIRLAYVTMTRAKQDAIVLTPRSDSYITHFF
jgi:DNA helicase-2/ATP-dependent DNA helicase PcrA